MGYREPLSFCGECGTAWTQGASACGSCGKPRVRATQVVKTGMSSGAGLVSALALYFVLLGTLLASYLLDTADFFDVLDSILIVDTIVVLIWAFVHRADLVGPLRTLGELRYWGIAVAAVPVTVAIAYANLWAAVHVVGTTNVDVLQLCINAGYSLPFLLLTWSLQPAVIEELAFRGIVFERLSAVVEPRAAIIVAAIAFTTLHMAVLSAVFLMCLGLLAGWLRWKSGSMYPSIALHLLHNAVVVVLMWTGVW
ncbi:type II CAAX endopeptidase family protein [Enhygromyxa salina]|uniref:CAAX amino terminal protease self-immunity n=1 Tax=Enhygromyxa salina TaxID=215803 RepID=A0A2S9YMG6_9BACT|nr:type II CAAX endopeptidase family protein [Enhygromyxa salina]PRQ06256.1 CAAX amino terminal protease self- immunity [Enhygromyxa salina]